MEVSGEAPEEGCGCQELCRRLSTGVLPRGEPAAIINNTLQKPHKATSERLSNHQDLDHS